MSNYADEIVARSKDDGEWETIYQKYSLDKELVKRAKKFWRSKKYQDVCVIKFVGGMFGLDEATIWKNGKWR